MLITVKQEDINNGNRRDASSCPMAMAIRRKFPKVNPSYINVVSRCCNINGEFYRLSNPAIRFIDKFDHYDLVKPETFTLIKVK